MGYAITYCRQQRLISLMATRGKLLVLAYNLDNACIIRQYISPFVAVPINDNSEVLREWGSNSVG